MEIVYVTLVMTALIAGQDFERHERMTSLEDCFSIAPKRFVEMQHGKFPGLPDLIRVEAIANIGVGCVAGIGDAL